jgi:hypothetical protein
MSLNTLTIPTSQLSCVVAKDVHRCSEYVTLLVLPAMPDQDTKMESLQNLSSISHETPFRGEELASLWSRTSMFPTTPWSLELINAKERNEKMEKKLEKMEKKLEVMSDLVKTLMKAGGSSCWFES